MALPSSSSPLCETVKNEPIDCIVSKLPDALDVDGQTETGGFQEYSIKVSAPPGSPLAELPKLPDALEVDEAIVTDGGRECSIEISTSASPSVSVLPSGNTHFEDASNGMLDVERGNVNNNRSSFPELKDVSQQSYRAIEEREKTRTFPVLLSGEEYYVPASMSNATSGFSSVESLSHTKESSSRVCNGVESDKESGSESEGDDSKTASSSDATNLPSPKEKLNGLVKDEPLQDILVSKIAELEVASTGPSKADEDDSKAVKARKRQLKEVRVLLDGTDRSAEEKLRLLNSKYQQQVAENRQLEKEYMALNRKCKQVNKEKDTLYGELTKSTALRQKLESLCRELQRQNKMFLDDSKRVAAEEEKKRLELSVKFHETVKDISAKLEEQGEDRLRQLEENELMREKLNHFTQQFDIREQQFAHQLRTKTLEHQLLEVKLKQQQDISMQAETKSRLYTEQIAQLLKTEQDLRSQLALYGDKFEQFQDTLTKSNEVFATFKIELEKMSKTVKKLEKENASLKKKCEKSDVSIIELLEERDVLKKLLSTTKNQKEKLEALCRSLQAERKLQSVTFDSANSSLPSQLENLKLSNPE
ncbi:unnamed protein product [Calypogeia fissa]